MRPRQTYLVLEELRINCEAQLYRKAALLSKEDSRTVTAVYLQWICLLTDLDYLHPDTLKRDSRRLWDSILTVDVLDLNNAMAECLDKIFHQDLRGFKVLCSRITPHLYSLISADVELVRQGDINATKKLVQVFSYTSRLSLKDINLTRQMIDDYMAVEDRIDPTLDHEIIPRLNEIIKRWFGAFCPYPIEPKHGPGGIAERGRCSNHQKYKLLGSDQRLEYCFPLDSRFIKSELSQGIDRCSKTIFVAKSYKTFRTISMEPCTLQFYQQGVQKAIDKQVSMCRYLRNRIGTHDQTRNRQLAQVGSFLRNYATIDLSSASDSVSYNLVKKLFRGTWLLRYFICLRSPRTKLPDKTVVELKKYAPMGSSLCFPVETILFASICEYVTREHHVNGDFSVYGDDIIVPSSCSSDVIKYLTELGFLVNSSKSFTDEDCWFRESCGGFYINGQDITPLRISRKYADQDQLERFTALCDMCNNCFKYGYRTLRLCFLQDLREEGVIPLFSPTSLMSDNYTNYHTKKKENTLLQRTEYKTHRLASKTRPFDMDDIDETFWSSEQIRYYHYWLTHHRSSMIVTPFDWSYSQKAQYYIKEEYRRKNPILFNGTVLSSVSTSNGTNIGQTVVRFKLAWRASGVED